MSKQVLWADLFPCSVTIDFGGSREQRNFSAAGEQTGKFNPSLEGSGAKKASRNRQKNRANKSGLG
jgi:hypothetical protein